MAFTATLADWASEAPRQHGPATLSRARDAMIDIVACMVAGSSDPATAHVIRAVGRPGRNGLATPAVAMVYGTAAHAQDFDDNFIPAYTHATAVLVPALLALAEAEGLSGRALVDAYIIGLELQARIGRLMLPRHYELGWHATTTIGAIGTAGACARLLGLNGAGILGAMSIATSMAGGSKKQFGSMMKPIHAGLAAHNAVLAARMAEAGIAGDREPICGPWGFVEHHLDAPLAVTEQQALDGLGGALALDTDGLLVKRFPCCAGAHKALDGMLALRERHSLDPAGIEQIEVTLPDVGRRNLRFDRPTDEMQARFSLTYSGARVLLQGNLMLADFTPDRVHDPAMRPWFDRFSISSVAIDPAVFKVAVRILMKDGTSFETGIDKVRGSLSNPLDVRELIAKVEDCSAWACCPIATAEVYAIGAALPEALGTGQVTSLLAGLMATPARTPAEVA
ncbi:MAG: MmgE/PrpD family protein [Rubritepida sp.]|nr:MmgE/PrpD family protein [Rubritepida sp.]